MTIGEILEYLDNIRVATDSLEVKGKNNAALICYICDRCDTLAQKLQEEAKKIQNESVANTEPEIVAIEVGDEDGQQNTKSA